MPGGAIDPLTVSDFGRRALMLSQTGEFLVFDAPGTGPRPCWR